MYAKIQDRHRPVAYYKVKIKVAEMPHLAAATSSERRRMTNIWIATAKPLYAGFTITSLAASSLLFVCLFI